MSEHREFMIPMENLNMVYELPKGQTSSSRNNVHVIEKAALDELVKALRVFTCEHRSKGQNYNFGCCHATEVIEKLGYKVQS